MSTIHHSYAARFGKRIRSVGSCSRCVMACRLLACRYRLFGARLQFRLMRLTLQEPTVGLLSPGYRSGRAEPRVPRRG
jgi:hypothetical protein